MLENPVLLMGRDRSHAMLKMTSEFLISEVVPLMSPTENAEWRLEKVVVKNKEITNDKKINVIGKKKYSNTGLQCRLRNQNLRVNG